jgi:hypothetical protein
MRIYGKKITVLLSAIAAVSIITSPCARAISIDIEVGDRPYYTEGPSYWDSGYEYVWVPGHWGEHHRWVHGAYTKHGEFVKEHAREHHKVRVHDDDHR